MEAECSGDAYNLEAWASWAHNTLQFTLSSSCANSNHPLAMLPSMDPSVVGGKSPSFLPSELPVSLGFSDHFNMGISSLTNRERTKKSQSSFLPCPLAGEYCVQLGRHLGGVSEQCAQCTGAMHTKK